MKFPRPQALPLPYTARRTYKASALATLTVVPVSALWGIIVTLFEGPYAILYFLYSLLFAIPITALLMCIFGIPGYLIAVSRGRVTLVSALIVAFIAVATIPIVLAFIAGSPRTIGIGFLILLPYGLTIAWTFYHLIKQPNQNQ